MTEPGEVRQKVQQARQLLVEGKVVKARALLKGIDHPKAQALVAQIEAQNPQTKHNTGFPMMPLFGLLLVVVAVVTAGIVIMKASNSPADEHVVVPTLIPTPDCTQDMVQAWWMEQNQMLDTFMANASAASRTMPGERLTTQLQTLRQMRDDVPDLPVCTSMEMQGAVTELLSAMDAVIDILERWSNGEIDGTQLTNEFYEAERRLREVREAVREIIP